MGHKKGQEGEAINQGEEDDFVFILFPGEENNDGSNKQRKSGKNADKEREGLRVLVGVEAGWAVVPGKLGEQLTDGGVMSSEIKIISHQELGLNVGLLEQDREKEEGREADTKKDCWGQKDKLLLSIFIRIEKIKRKDQKNGGGNQDSDVVGREKSSQGEGKKNGVACLWITADSNDGKKDQRHQSETKALRQGAADKNIKGVVWGGQISNGGNQSRIFF